MNTTTVQRLTLVACFSALALLLLFIMEAGGVGRGTEAVVLVVLLASGLFILYWTTVLGKRRVGSHFSELPHGPPGKEEEEPESDEPMEYHGDGGEAERAYLSRVLPRPPVPEPEGLERGLENTAQSFSWQGEDLPDQQPPTLEPAYSRRPESYYQKPTGLYQQPASAGPPEPSRPPSPSSPPQPSSPPDGARPPEPGRRGPPPS